MQIFMFSNRSSYMVVTGFVIGMVLVVAVIAIGSARMSDMLATTEQLVRAQNLKTRLIMDMYTSVRERSVILSRIGDATDPFKRDESRVRFTELASEYSVARNSLLALLKTSQERFLYAKQSDFSRSSARLQNQVMELFMEGRDNEARSLLFSTAIPSQDRVLVLLQSMLEYQGDAANDILLSARQDYYKALTLMVLFSLTVFSLAGAGAVVIKRRISKIDDAVFARVTLESIDDAVVATDASGRVIYLNGKAAELAGQAGRNVTGMLAAELLPCFRREDISESLASKQTIHKESVIPSGNCSSTQGEVGSRDIDFSISPISGGQSEKQGAVLIFRDITRRKQMENQLRRSEERFALVMEGANDGIWDYNLETGEVYYSPRWKSMLGYDVEEFGNTFLPWQDLVHGDDLGGILDAWTDCMSGSSDSFVVQYRMKSVEGNWLWFESRGIVAYDERDQPVRLVGSHTDITERKCAQEELHWHSTHDSLTGLMNRREFEDRLDYALKEAQRFSSEHVLLYIDLDQFKVVNDTCGHVAGDELLRQLSAMLGKRIRNTDTLARLGGDEFGLLLNGCPPDEAGSVANMFREAIGEFRFAWENLTLRVGASIGMVAVNRSSSSRRELMSAADVACYTAKDLGRNRVYLYQESDDQLVVRHREMHWVSRITKALQEDRFVLYQQPIKPVVAGAHALTHHEILVRMLDENGALVAPGVFIPSAERYNLMPEIDRWVVRNLFAALAERKASYARDCDVISTVNLSGSSFNQEGFGDFIEQQFRVFGIAPARICFEITETAAIGQLSHASSFIHQLKKLGCLFALDDFGSGLSSFGYLKNLPVDFLKIDGQFVKDIVDDPIDAAMVRSINEIGRVMGMKTIAEFVENDAILECLSQIGVDYAQGYGVARPVPLIDRECSSKAANG